MFPMFLRLETFQSERAEISLRDWHPSNMLAMFSTFETSHDFNEVMSDRDSHPRNIPSILWTSPKPKAIIAFRFLRPAYRPAKSVFPNKSSVT